MKIRHLDHVGIVVNDLEAATGFFMDLDFVQMGRTTVEGEWVGKIIGLGNVRSDIVMLHSPDAQINIELSKFHEPKVEGGGKQIAANTLGIRHIALQVEGLEELVSMLKHKGWPLVGEIKTYENAWKLCYVQGPDGISVELAEQLEV